MKLSCHFDLALGILIYVSEVQILSIRQISESCRVQISRSLTLKSISARILALHQDPECDDNHNFEKVARERVSFSSTSDYVSHDGAVVQHT
jgi:hypothetical protein